MTAEPILPGEGDIYFATFHLRNLYHGCWVLIKNGKQLDGRSHTLASAKHRALKLRDAELAERAAA
jgi:hypothetical protein